MTDTPIIDAAIAAGNHLRHKTFRDMTIAILRAANPWTPPADEIEAMARARYQVPIEQSHDQRRTNYWVGASNTVKQNERAGMLDAYRARPIMRELYDSDGAPR